MWSGQFLLQCILHAFTHAFVMYPNSTVYPETDHIEMESEYVVMELVSQDQRMYQHQFNLDE